MGTPLAPHPVQYFCGVISAPAFDLNTIERRLAAAFGPVDFTSPVFPFDITDFYEKEMGAGLKKIFYCFKELRPPEDIAGVKLATNAMEQADLQPGDGGRVVNLDPGYVEHAKMVLATTKNSGPRIYLHSGIYAESTLAFVSKSFRPWPWTYPDYKSAHYIEFFNELRERYTEKLRRGYGGSALFE